MHDGLKKYLLKPTGNWMFWIGLALAFKLSFFLFKIDQAEAPDLPGFIGEIAGDSYSYLLPIENLVDHGTYSPDYRMPGYGFIYLPLLLFFSKATACNILILLQVAVASVATYCLALIARNGFRSDTPFYFTFYFYALSCYSNLFDHFLLTESFCTSSLIISIYYFSQFIVSRKLSNLFASGLFLTWGIFLRPVYAPLFLLILVLLIYDGLRRPEVISVLLKKALIFICSFLIIESIWVARNYAVQNKIVILTSTFYYPEIESSYTSELIGFLKAWGGDFVWWNPEAEIRWFGLGQNKNNRITEADLDIIVLPTYIYTSQFNLDSLKIIRKYILKINNDEDGIEKKSGYEAFVKNRLKTYTQSIRTEKPFLYYGMAPLHLLKKFLIHSGTYNLFNKPSATLSYWELSIKIFYSIFYLATLLFGLAGLLMLLMDKESNVIPMVIAGMVLYSIILFPFALRLIEFRYFVPAYPFMCILATYFFYSMRTRISLKQ